MKTKILSALAFILCFAFATISFAQKMVTDTTVIIKVSGIYCPMCPPAITARLKIENGIKNCLELGKPAIVSKFQVTYDTRVISYLKVVNAIEDTKDPMNPAVKPYRVKKKK